MGGLLGELGGRITGVNIISPVTPPRLVTAVVGAGPAGLYFAITGRLLHERLGRDVSDWEIILLDRRTEYGRTHRLRMDPARHRSLQQDIADDRFDRLIEYLAQEGFKPVINELERKLSRLAADLGLTTHQLAIGDGPGEVSVNDLPGHLRRKLSIPPDLPMTVVGADSVNSAVRAAVQGAEEPVRHTHQTVARFHVVGDTLPDRINPVAHYRMAKLISSLIDYRLNRNGYAEVDVFLDPEDQGELEKFGAHPKRPIDLSRSIEALTSQHLRRLLGHLRSGISDTDNEIFLQSTFRLEHAYMERVAYPHAADGAHVFLVGDAAISLPFFRGMASLAGLVGALAHVHLDLLTLGGQLVEDRVEGARLRASVLAPDRPLRLGTKLLPGEIEHAEPTIYRGESTLVILHRWLSLYGVHMVGRSPEGEWLSLFRRAPISRSPARSDFENLVDPICRYNVLARRIRNEELKVVNARSMLVRGAREFVRVSAMLPFPLQTWFLTARASGTPGSAPARGGPLNPAIALIAGLMALVAPVAALFEQSWMVLWWAALPVQAIGGFVYRASLVLDQQGATPARRVWIVQIAAVMVGGVATTLISSLSMGALTQLRAALSWLVLGLVFIPGMYLFEYLDRKWFAAARLDEEAPR